MAVQESILEGDDNVRYLSPYYMPADKIHTRNAFLLELRQRVDVDEIEKRLGESLEDNDDLLRGAYAALGVFLEGMNQ